MSTHTDTEREGERENRETENRETEDREQRDRQRDREVQPNPPLLLQVHRLPLQLDMGG